MIKILTATNDKALNAGPKAKMDIINFLKESGIDKIESEMVYLVNSSNESKKNPLSNKIKNLGNRVKLVIKNVFCKDYILIQYPLITNIKIFNLLPKKNTIILIHDLQGIRTQSKELEEKEINILKKFPCIIVHNKSMEEYLKGKGVKSNFIDLEIFDYKVNGEVKNDEEKSQNIVYVGNLKKIKTPFLYQLDESKMNFKINLYGIGIENDINTKLLYKGSYQPDELPKKINGRLGLVWDGNYDESDENIGFKNYLRYNNPHKLSCYISAGIPVIVWEKSAVANFVRKKNIGYTINSIYDINNIDFSDYNSKIENVKIISKKVKDGFYIKKAIKEAIKVLGNR